MAASQYSPYEIFKITSVRLKLVLTPAQVQGNTKGLFTQGFHSINIPFKVINTTSRPAELTFYAETDPKRTSYLFNLPLLFSYSFILDCDLARFHKLTEVSLGHWLDVRSKPLQSGSFPWVAIKGGSATKSFSWGLNFQELGSVVTEGFGVDLLPGQSWTVIRAQG